MLRKQPRIYLIHKSIYTKYYITWEAIYVEILKIDSTLTACYSIYIIYLDYSYHFNISYVMHCVL